MDPWRQKADYLDVVLVPCGLLLMFGYHLLLIHRYLKRPELTLIGFENHSKKTWIKKILEIKVKDRSPAISVIGGHISAATSFSSMSLFLCAVIAALIGSSTATRFPTEYIYGNRSVSMVYVKYVSLLSCFFVAFVCFVQTARYFVHANFLISMPASGGGGDVPASCVVRDVTRGSNFWVVGLRSLYFATSFVMWIFGPVPMFVCSVVTVGVLARLDRNTTPLRSY